MSYDRPHETYVQGPIGGAGAHAGWWFASCRRCGSDVFPDRPTHAQARVDAEGHGSYYPASPNDADEKQREDERPAMTGGDSA